MVGQDARETVIAAGASRSRGVRLATVRFGLFIATDRTGSFAWLLRPGETLPNVPGLRFEVVRSYASEDEGWAAMDALDRMLRDRARVKAIRCVRPAPPRQWRYRLSGRAAPDADGESRPGEGPRSSDGPARLDRRSRFRALIRQVRRTPQLTCLGRWTDRIPGQP
jgi:hypothetical protein